jgi:chromosome segregation ATPase
VKDCECQGVGHTPWCRVGKKIAADERDRLTAENERLTRERDEAVRYHESNAAEYGKLAEAQREELERLRDRVKEWKRAASSASVRAAMAENAADGYRQQRDSALAELTSLQKYVATHDEEYLTMKDVLRAEHAECQRMRPVFEAALEWRTVATEVATEVALCNAIDTATEAKP